MRAEPLSPFASLAAAPVALRRGRGFACAFKNVGFSFGFPERCEAEIHLHGDGRTGTSIGRVDLFHAGAEVGQGAHQAFLQMAAEAVGVRLEPGRRPLLRHVNVGRLRFGVGIAHDLDGRQLDPRRRRGGREAVARRAIGRRSASSASCRRPPNRSTPRPASAHRTSPTATWPRQSS